jgi:hypothetical protein
MRFAELRAAWARVPRHPDDRIAESMAERPCCECGRPTGGCCAVALPHNCDVCAENGLFRDIRDVSPGFWGSLRLNRAQRRAAAAVARREARR